MHLHIVTPRWLYVPLSVEQSRFLAICTASGGVLNRQLMGLGYYSNRGIYTVYNLIIARSDPLVAPQWSGSGHNSLCLFPMHASIRWKNCYSIHFWKPNRKVFKISITKFFINSVLTETSGRYIRGRNTYNPTMFGGTRMKWAL